MKIMELALAAALLATAAGCAKSRTSRLSKVEDEETRFTLIAPGAKEVALVGAFDGWATSAHRMATTDGQTWEVAVPLKPGRYAFVFLVDSRVVKPPHATLYAEDGFGGENGVIVVR